MQEVNKGVGANQGRQVSETAVSKRDANRQQYRDKQQQRRANRNARQGVWGYGTGARHV